MMRLVEFCYCWKTFSSLRKKKSSCGLANDTLSVCALHKTRAEEEKLFISPIGGQCAHTLTRQSAEIAKGNSSQQETECNQGSTVAQLMIQFSAELLFMCPALVCAWEHDEVLLVAMLYYRAARRPHQTMQTCFSLSEPVATEQNERK